MKKIIILALMFVASSCWAQSSMWSVPGMADFAANAVKASRIILLLDLDGGTKKGIELPLKRLHDSAGNAYVEFGVGATTQHFNDAKPLINLDIDLTSTINKLLGYGWLGRHISSPFKLPDFWVGPNLRIPLPEDHFRFSDIRNFVGMSMSVGF